MGFSEFEQLLQRYYEGSCTPDEKTWVDQWLKSSTLNQENSWSQLSAEEQKIFINHLYRDIHASIADARYDEPLDSTRRFRWWWAAAAACAAVFIYFMAQESTVGDQHGPSQIWAGLEVEAGSRKKITLSDGTMIWLQGGSKLVYPEKFDSTVRMVELEGEAFFEVASNKEKPFIVKSGSLEAEVLGTSFNMVVFDEVDEKTVSLVEGKLAVRTVGDREALPTEIILTPSEQAVYSEGVHTLSKAKIPVLVSAEDFKLGRLHFRETPLEEVLIRVGKAYGITLYYDQEKASKHKINAVYAISDPVREVLQNLARSTGSGLVWKGEKNVDFNIK